ncbi:hypothetical protein NDU88_008658 [Pleurodeles waltl]|uniref:Uncharacterized protein n=1 Tax=Pleurodeles waltl TaxID=8319 RepID=A0AAV7PQF8_PLEWA|nr:hypothetical protein NDU88_008658 [Pleurodeles waltl]
MCNAPWEEERTEHGPKIKTTKNTKHMDPWIETVRKYRDRNESHLRCSGTRVEHSFRNLCVIEDIRDSIAGWKKGCGGHNSSKSELGTQPWIENGMPQVSYRPVA